MEIKEVKTYISKGIPVQYDNTSYTITACILRIHKGQWYYQLELTQGNTVVIAEMEKVK